ncbi:MAG: manganese catalase family protein [Candidatus Acidiferrales bacterium]|jgi:Mn-containing catalase
MYHHVKKLMYTVDVGEADPKFGKMLLEQFGGANGELAAAMQYSIQGINCEDAARKDLLMDIGTEELSHLEVVGALIRMHLKPMKSSRESAEADPLVAIAGGGGVALCDSMGNAWTSTYLKITGDLAVDLRSNIAAEARAKIVYERLIAFTQDAGSKQALQFLMTREITHMRAFTAALESMDKPQFSVGIIQPTPKLVDQFFNGSTGESQYGEADYDGPWNSANGLTAVESEIKGGEGLDVTPYDPKPGTETTSPIDSTPVGEYTGEVGRKQAAIHDKANAQAAKNATVEV